MWIPIQKTSTAKAHKIKYNVKLIKRTEVVEKCR